MFEQLVIHQTPITFPLYTQTFFEGPKNSNSVRARSHETTSTTGSRNIVSTNTPMARGTATVADLSERNHKGATSGTLSDTTQLDLLEKTRNDRVYLLARKYAAGIDTEANARLEILTARLDQILPPVEAATVSRVAEILEGALRPNKALESLKSKYCI